MQHLSKSRIKQGIQCKKQLHLQVYQSKLARPFTENEKRLFDQGHRVQSEAEKLFKNGYKTTAPYWKFDLALKQTHQAIEQNYPYIFEAFFSFDNTLARVDILELNPDHWNVIEVKSSLSVKEDHIQDLAIQKYILDCLGHPVKKCFVMHLNRGSTYPNKNLFIKKDVTEEINAYIPNVKKHVEEFRSVLKDKNTPEVPIGVHCKKPYPCRFIDHCWKHIPKPSVFDIPQLGEESWEYYNKTQIALSDVPDENLQKRQRIYKQVQITGEPYINKSNIQKEITSWKWPLYFLDFETISEAIPRFEKAQPLQHIPFQFSCIKQKDLNVDLLKEIDTDQMCLSNSEDDLVSEAHYLHDQPSDPRKPLAKALVEFFKERGSIVAYYKQFESQRLKELAFMFPEYKHKLLDIESRLVDPLPLLREEVCFKEFESSWSIKSVAPVLLGDHWKYSHLKVQDGLMAQSHFYEMIQKEDESSKESMKQQLISYCRQDTLTLALIVKWLFEQI